MKKHSSKFTPSQATWLSDILGTIQDFPKPGIVFRDVCPMLKSREAFACAIDGLSASDAARARNVTIVGIESRGFIFGAAMAGKLWQPFVPARKAGKLPGSVDRASYALEYGEATLEMQAGSLHVGQAVIIVDDLLATGGTALAAAELVRRQGANVVEFAFVIELEDLGGRAKLEAIAPVHALLTY